MPFEIRTHRDVVACSCECDSTSTARPRRADDEREHVCQTPSSDEAIRSIVARLARPHRSGASVIERAASLAEGDRSAAILDWIVAHAGEPQIAASAAPAQGLYGTGFGGDVTAPRGPARHVLPAGTLAPAR
jgi:hypothetical protein